MQPHKVTLAGTNDALIVAVGKMGGKCVAIFTVDRPDIPDMVRDFVDNHRRLMADHPGEVPNDPGNLAHDVLMAGTAEINDSCKDAVCHAAVYFLSLSTDPQDLIGPTLVAVDEVGVGSKPLDVRRTLEAAGKMLH